MAVDIATYLAKRGKNIKPAGDTSGRAPMEVYEPYIQETSREFDLDPDMLRAQLYQESKGDSLAVSHAGAEGVMQFMPATAREVGLKNPFIAKDAVRAGGKYMRQQLDRFGGDYDKALAAYNSGAGNVRKAVRRGGDAWLDNLVTAPKYAKETRGYVKDINKRAGKTKEAPKGVDVEAYLARRQKDLAVRDFLAKRNPPIEEQPTVPSITQETQAPVTDIPGIPRVGEVEPRYPIDYTSDAIKPTEELNQIAPEKSETGLTEALLPSTTATTEEEYVPRYDKESGRIVAWDKVEGSEVMNQLSDVAGIPTRFLGAVLHQGEGEDIMSRMADPEAGLLKAPGEALQEVYNDPETSTAIKALSKTGEITLDILEDPLILAGIFKAVPLLARKLYKPLTKKVATKVEPTVIAKETPVAKEAPKPKEAPVIKEATPKTPETQIEEQVQKSFKEIPPASKSPIKVEVPRQAIKPAVGELPTKIEYGKLPKERAETLHESVKSKLAKTSDPAQKTKLKNIKGRLENRIRVVSKEIDEKVRVTSLRETLTDEFYDRASKQVPVKKKMTLREVRDKIDKLVTPMSSVVERISKPVMYRVKTHAKDVVHNANKDKQIVDGFLQKLLPLRKSLGKKLKKSSAEITSDQEKLSKLGYALSHRDEVMSRKLLREMGIEKEFNKVKHYLTKKASEAKKAGLPVNVLEDYYPRSVRDFPGLSKEIRKNDKWSSLQKLLDAENAKAGKVLSPEEQVAVINSFFKRTKPKGVAVPKNLKARSLEIIPPELYRYYDDPIESLVKYIDSINKGIADKKLFGKHARFNKTGSMDLDASIGELVNNTQVKKGKVDMSPEDQRELQGVLEAYMNPGKMGKFSSTYRDVELMSTLGSFKAALTQISDASFASKGSGILNAMEAYIKSIGRRVPGLKDKIKWVTAEDAGVYRMSQEFAEPTKTAAALDLLLKSNLMSTVDKIGKETIINASLKKAKQLANKQGSTRLMSELEPMFGKHAKKVFNDLKAGRITDEVETYANHKITELQPTSLFEMPEAFARAEKAKLFYTLQSFTVKHINVTRNALYRDIKNAKNKEETIAAVGSLARFLGSFFALGVGVGTMKDIAFNREVELGDTVLDNIWKLTGIFNKYTLNKLSKDGPVKVGSDILLPPFSVMNDAWKDYKQSKKDEGLSAKNSALIKRFPLFGDIYYSWGGRGAGLKEKYKHKNRWEGYSDLKDENPGAYKKAQILKRKYNKLKKRQEEVRGEASKKRLEAQMKKEVAKFEKLLK
ncbi:MAG: transglycosylase SLT domain-containing protein [bacterium]|nr:transglycosylase SLT domain-containing protein [bacterium]